MPEVIDHVRPLTPKARRRSWNEPVVRIWLIAAVVLLLVGVWLLIAQMQVARNGSYRLTHWKRVSGVKIEKIGRETVHTFRATPEIAASMESVLSYRDSTGVQRQLEGYLSAQTDAVRPGDLITVLIDPDNPTNFTDRLRPLPIADEFMGPLLVLPLPVLCLFVALWQRHVILKIWRTGIERQGRIVGRKSSAVAPRSAALQCVMEGSRDDRIVTVTVPLGRDPFQKGSILALITPAGYRSNRAIVASLYR